MMETQRRMQSRCEILMRRRWLHAADEVGYAVDLVCFAIVCNAIEYLQGCKRANKGCGSDLYGGRANDEKFNGVARCGYAAHADDRDGDPFDDFPEEGEGDGFDRGSR